MDELIELEGFFIYVITCICVYVEVTGQLSGVSYVLPSYGVEGAGLKTGAPVWH